MQGMLLCTPLLFTSLLFTPLLPTPCSPHPCSHPPPQACLEVVEQRETRYRVQWYYRLFDETHRGLQRTSQIECVHGSLMALGELVQHTGALFVCDALLVGAGPRRCDQHLDALLHTRPSTPCCPCHADARYTHTHRRVHAGEVPGGGGDGHAIPQQQGAADSHRRHHAAAAPGELCARALCKHLPAGACTMHQTASHEPLRSQHPHTTHTYSTASRASMFDSRAPLQVTVIPQTTTNSHRKRHCTWCRCSKTPQSGALPLRPWGKRPPHWPASKQSTAWRRTCQQWPPRSATPSPARAGGFETTALLHSRCAMPSCHTGPAMPQPPCLLLCINLHLCVCDVGHAALTFNGQHALLVTTAFTFFNHKE